MLLSRSEKVLNPDVQMTHASTKILLSEILDFGDTENVKIRFNVRSDNNWNPIELFKSGEIDKLLRGQYWNYKSQKSFKVGQTTVGLLRLNQPDLWLLFHVGQITRDLNILDGVGYEYVTLPQFDKYLGRLIVKYKNRSQTMIRLAKSVIEQCEVMQILPDIFDNDIFPGYDQVNISWDELSRVVTKQTWQTALQNQKGVYLLTDSTNGKMYVGSASGDQMLLGRWKSYVENGHGGNVDLKPLSIEHIKANFRYSILDIFKSTTNDDAILARESWWKIVLNTRTFGYNRN